MSFITFIMGQSVVTFVCTQFECMSPHDFMLSHALQATVMGNQSSDGFVSAIENITHHVGNTIGNRVNVFAVRTSHRAFNNVQLREYWHQQLGSHRQRQGSTHFEKYMMQIFEKFIVSHFRLLIREGGMAELFRGNKQASGVHERRHWDLLGCFN